MVVSASSRAGGATIRKTELSESQIGRAGGATIRMGRTSLLPEEIRSF
jgi:hypothetical protein